MNQLPLEQSFAGLEDAHDLVNVRASLVALGELLDRELKAVAHMNVDALHGVNEEKRGIVERLERLLQQPLQPNRGCEDPERTSMQKSVRDLAGKIRIRAHANAALISDALNAIASALGVGDHVGTYDRRARRQRYLVGSRRTSA